MLFHLGIQSILKKSNILKQCLRICTLQKKIFLKLLHPSLKSKSKNRKKCNSKLQGTIKKLILKTHNQKYWITKPRCLLRWKRWLDYPAKYQIIQWHVVFMNTRGSSIDQLRTILERWILSTRWEMLPKTARIAKMRWRLISTWGSVFS